MSKINTKYIMRKKVDFQNGKKQGTFSFHRNKE